MASPVVIAGIANGRAEWIAWLNALVILNYGLLKANALTGNRLPALYHSGVIYQAEERSGQKPEHFDPCTVVYARGWGDCDDLAAWRCAELILSGVEARIDLHETPRSKPAARRYHVLVVLPDGTTEDPSMICLENKTRTQRASNMRFW
jgi:hypothetical protein